MRPTESQSTFMPKPTILRSLPQNGSRKTFFYLGISVLVVLGGIGTGWYLSGAKANFGQYSPNPTGIKTNETEAGISDVSGFQDATGTLEEGGIEGEGTHHLTRDGGPSQTITLTSTVIDLESFVGKKVQIWGETSATKKAVWFMDVVKIKSL